MKKEDIVDLPPGAEMDRLIDERITGPSAGAAERGDERVRGYSTEIRHAERVLLRIVTAGDWSYVQAAARAAAPETVVFRRVDGRRVAACAPTRSLAICRAALLTTLEDPEP